MKYRYYYLKGNAAFEYIGNVNDHSQTTLTIVNGAETSGEKEIVRYNQGNFEWYGFELDDYGYSTDFRDWRKISPINFAKINYKYLKAAKREDVLLEMI